MIWMSWRQFRAQAIIGGSVLAVFAVVMIVTGIGLADLYNSSGLSGCAAHHTCGTAMTTFKVGFADPYEAVAYLAIVLIYVTPALIGAFWGAPLVAREFEASTFRLAWTQSVSRSRWLAIKVAVVGLAAVALAGLMSLLLTWWSGPVYRAAQAATPNSSLSVNRLGPMLFGVNGVAPLGYAAFAFALGLTAGALLRRTIPAMAVTLAGFAAVQVIWPGWIRPHLLSPARSTGALNVSAINELAITNNKQMIIVAGTNKPDAWVLTDQTLNSAGQPFTGPPTHACIDGSQQACNNSLAGLHLRQLVTYQSANRFWPLQGIETGIFLLLAVGLAALCAWQLRRRRIA